VNSAQWSVLLLLERSAEVKAKFITVHCSLITAGDIPAGFRQQADERGLKEKE
jgi:hypothetical protein